MEKRTKTKLNGRMNICGQNIKKFRKALDPNFSQEKLAEKLQLLGLNAHKNMIQMIEAGKQTVTDIELTFFAKALNVSVSDLMQQDEPPASYEETKEGYGIQSAAQTENEYK